ncbi:hypothetical protein DF185_21890 [Marinifilum breve]|uniref:Uncharacterized protein n=1 Tax=Marinifilum breve TaxID=2184082 RepID=A0A2V3ZRU2_9BACT|nr:DUF6261 family protein [Marinifilum breve]PXX95747.1 hypothetical protein DF185_21890 [Marinifilum breve]
MTLIKKISTNSRNGDVSTLLTLILGAFAKSDWSLDVYLSELINTIRGYCTSLTEALNRLKVYSQMAEKDNIRDMAIKSLFKLVEGYTHIPIAEINEAAKVVENVLEQYGMDIRNDDYAAETAEVNSLLNDLSKPEVAAAIAKLQGVAEIVAALTAAEKDFEAIALQQAEGEGAKKDLATASRLKKAALKEINDNLVGYMNTMAKVKPDTYQTTTQTIAELIENNNELVKRRRTKSDEEVEAEAI